MRLLVLVLFILLSPFSALADEVGGFHLGPRCLVGQAETRLRLTPTVTVSGRHDFAQCGVVGGYRRSFGDSPVFWGVTAGLYGLGLHGSERISGAGYSLTTSYSQPVTATFGLELGFTEGRWSTHVEAGLLAARHDFSLLVGWPGGSTSWSGTTESVGYYVGAGVGYQFSRYGQVTAGVQYSLTESDRFIRRDLTGLFGVTWRF